MAKWYAPFISWRKPIRDPRLEGLDPDNIHKFYHNLIDNDMFWNDG